MDGKYIKGTQVDIMRLSKLKKFTSFMMDEARKFGCMYVDNTTEAQVVEMYGKLSGKVFCFTNNTRSKTFVWATYLRNLENKVLNEKINECNESFYVILFHPYFLLLVLIVLIFLVPTT